MPDKEMKVGDPQLNVSFSYTLSDPSCSSSVVIEATASPVFTITVDQTNNLLAIPSMSSNADA